MTLNRDQNQSLDCHLEIPNVDPELGKCVYNVLQKYRLATEGKIIEVAVDRCVTL